MSEPSLAEAVRRVRRLPLAPTLIVAAAVALMLGLGAWQLFWRAPQKDALLASHVNAQGRPEIALSAATQTDEPPLFRKARGHCREVTGWRQVAGENRRGEIGYAFLADCRTGAEGPDLVVDAGWSANPQTQPNWSGGLVAGVVAPDRSSRIRLVSATGLGGLEASAAPSPAMIRNNHRSYAFQWFAFAILATIIYALALRSRRRKEAVP